MTNFIGVERLCSQAYISFMIDFNIDQSQKHPTPCLPTSIESYITTSEHHAQSLLQISALKIVQHRSAAHGQHLFPIRLLCWRSRGSGVERVLRSCLSIVSLTLPISWSMNKGWRLTHEKIELSAIRAVLCFERVHSCICFNVHLGSGTYMLAFAQK